MKNMALFILLFSLLAAKAQDKCDTSVCLHEKAGKYKIEMEKSCGDKLTVYVHTADNAPLLGKEILGYVDYFYSAKNYAVEDLYQFPGSNRLEAVIPSPGYFNAKVTLVIDKETVSAFFNNECMLRAENDTSVMLH
jgi:hypothetical protein